MKGDRWQISHVLGVTDFVRYPDGRFSADIFTKRFTLNEKLL
jgi:hypothetical protein